MAVRIEALTDGIDLREVEFPEHGIELLQRQLDAALQAFRGHGLGRQGGLQAVLHGEQLGGEVLDRELVGGRDLVLRALADVVGLRLGAQPGVVVFLRGELGIAQLLFETRDRFATALL